MVGLTEMSGNLVQVDTRREPNPPLQAMSLDQSPRAVLNVFRDFRQSHPGLNRPFSVCTNESVNFGCSSDVLVRLGRVLLESSLELSKFRRAVSIGVAKNETGL